MKLWIDDFRDAPDDTWTEARKVEQAIRLLAYNNWNEISIDHDIENRPDDETFKPVAFYIALKFMGGERDEFHQIMGIPKITIHSDNPVGAKQIQGIFSDFGIHDVPWQPFTSHADFKRKYGLD